MADDNGLKKSGMSGRGSAAHNGAKPAYRDGKNLPAAHGGRASAFAKGGAASAKRNGAGPLRAEGATPSRKAAYKALKLVLRQGAYSSLALDEVLSNMKLSAPDRALATEIFYGTLENLIRLDYMLSLLMERPPEAEAQDILRMSAYQLLFLERVPENAVCDEAVKLTRELGLERATGLVNGVLRNMLRRRTELVPPARAAGLTRYLSISYSMPEFVCERLIEQYGAELTEQILARRSGRYIIVVRPNTLRISPTEFERSLDAENIHWERSRVSGAYRVSGMGAVSREKLYRSGQLSVQGESSLMCAQALAPKPGMQVLDACAAPGGKSAALMELMQGAGRVYACDVHAHRVELIRATAARLGHDGIKPCMWDATRFNPDWAGAMDAVLCDAPCSGLGVVAEKPDIKLSLAPEAFKALPELQKRILANCARYVRPGGTLVYSTCTLLECENQAVVREFLASQPDFVQDDIRPYLPEFLRGRADGGMIALLGCRDDMDGFFIARMKRKKR